MIHSSITFLVLWVVRLREVAALGVSSEFVDCPGEELNCVVLCMMQPQYIFRGAGRKAESTKLWRISPLYQTMAMVLMQHAM